MPKLSDNAKKVFETLYSFTDESIENTFKRVADEFGTNKKEKELAYELQENGIWRPNTPVYLNAGTKHKIFSACFIVSLKDSMDSIYDVANVSRKIFGYGAGVGIPIGNLRGKEESIFEGEPDKAPEGKSCLTGDTILLNDKTHIAVENQKITIKWLYDYYQKVKNPKYMVRSMLDEFLIGKNIITDVVYNGKRKVYEITTKDGYRIKATINHRFLSESGEWKEVGNFGVGDKIGVNGKTRPISECKRCGKIRLLRGDRSKYKGLCENCVVSVFHGCSLKGTEEEFQKRSNARKEYRNRKEIKEYYSKINSGENNPMWRGDYANETTARQRNKDIYLWHRENHTCERCGETEKRIEVHHKDGNPYNNDINNLEVLCTQCHNDEHKKRRAKGNYRLTKEVYFDEIISIKYVGMDDVYDIKMKEPYHNFIANGFVSHNSGPIVFMKLYDAVGETTKSGGRVRRAAILCTMHCWHPDIMDFISSKEIDGTYSNMNISVSFTDKFMEHLNDNVPFPLVTPYDGTQVGTINPKDLWDKLVEMAHKTGDPGVIFIDTVNRYNPLKKRMLVETPNPCGEIVLPPFNCCNLSAINVSKFIKDNEIDYKSLYEVSYDVAKLMDNVIDTMHYPDPRFEMNSKRYRPIGIGFMGLSDLFYMLDIKYDSAIGKRTAGKIMRTITSGAVNASADMAKEKGKFHDYDVFKEDVENIVFQHIKGHWDEDLLKKKIEDNGLRNCEFTAVAPTGTTALSCDASYGMEPCFGLVFKKNLVDGTSMNIANPVFRDRFKDEDWYNESLIEKISQNNGSLKGIHGVPKKVRDIFVTAHDIKWKDRIDVQSSIQQHCSNAISSTINLSEDTPKDEIDKIYKYAYEKGLKGITIYRDGSKQSQPVVFGKKQREVTLEDFDRPSKLSARVHKLDTGNGKMYVTVSSYDGKPIEVFLHVGKSGQVVNTFSEALGRVISIALQNNVSIDSIVKTLIGINSDKPTWTRFDESETKMKQVLSVPDGLAQLLKRFYSNGNRNELDTSGELCPKCGTSFLLNIEGCSTCSDCGYSACA